MKLILQQNGIFLQIKNDINIINTDTLENFLNKYNFNSYKRSWIEGQYITIRLVEWNTARKKTDKIQLFKTKRKKNAYENKKFNDFSDEMKKEFIKNNEFLQKNKDKFFANLLTEDEEDEYEEIEYLMKSLFYELNKETYEKTKEMLEFLNLQPAESFKNGFIFNSTKYDWRREIEIISEISINRNTGGSSVSRELNFLNGKQKKIKDKRLKF